MTQNNVVWYYILDMAKKKKGVENNEGLEPQTENEKAVIQSDPMDALSREERRKYRKAVRSLRRSEWLEEYWIIMILSLVVLALMIALTIGKAVHDKKEQEELEREQQQEQEEEEDPLEQLENYNIREEYAKIIGA